MSKNKAFTLIELLVVIAIIALLLSILMPALGKVKVIAQEVVCKSNIRQYFLATNLYVQEQGEILPTALESLYNDQISPKETSNGWDPSCRWHNAGLSLNSYPELAGPYWPYLSVTEANICPSFNKMAKKYGPSHQGHTSAVPQFDVQFSYSMNSFLGGKKLVKIKNPSSTFFWAEENLWTLAALSVYPLNDNALVAEDPSVTPISDCFASFHKISVGMLDTQTATGQYNGGLSAVLFLDGSLSYESPEDTYRLSGKN